MIVEHGASEVANDMGGMLQSGSHKLQYAQAERALPNTVKTFH